MKAAQSSTHVFMVILQELLWPHAAVVENLSQPILHVLLVSNSSRLNDFSHYYFSFLACNGDPPAPSDALEENNAVAGTQYHTESTITYNCITDTTISATIMCPAQEWEAVPMLLCRKYKLHLFLFGYMNVIIYSLSQ